MQIKLPKALIEAISLEKLKPFNIDRHSLYGVSYLRVDLNKLPLDKVKELHALIKPYDRGTDSKIRGAATALGDIDSWLKLIENPTGQKPRNVEHFTSLVKEYLRSAPGHRLYQKTAERWLSYYVNRVKYFKQERHDGWITPARCVLSLLYTSQGDRQTESISFEMPNVANMDVVQALRLRNLLIETDELRIAYLLEEKRWEKEVALVGKQFLATGSAMTEPDGDGWWRRGTSLTLDKDGVPARVVIDVPVEGDKSDRGRDRDGIIDAEFWGQKPGEPDPDEDEELEVKHLDAVEVPIHAELMVFDLTRQLRLEVFIDQLTEYKYDLSLGEKLVLPKDARHLVDLLMAGTGGFQDIIGNKGGGSIIACTGIPGTGKTLTSEVYAEVAKRPLYTVQCSQLGTTPEELETQLLQVFSRSQRWNAILLLDEADVYVAKRGSDLIQNAIVGVFLRVLEYYKGVMFLTTNRADLIDDAVLSRCIARIDYATPAIDDQKRIWRVLADNAKIALPDSVIDEVMSEWKNLTGRDIKNLLKLGSMIATAEGRPISKATIDFAKRFKPTQD